MKDAGIIIGLIVLLFVAWIGTGGPTRPISFAGPYLNPISHPGTTAQPYGDPSEYSAINSTVTIGTGGVRSSGSTQKSVTLSRSAGGAHASDADQEYVSINVASSATGSISTAGWRLVSAASGRSLVFPQGTETPESGHVNTLVPITLHAGDEAIVTTGRSPVGISFRENVCSGYLEEHQDFYPSLSLTCPTPSDELTRAYPNADDECVSAVRSIPYCGTDVPSYAENDLSSSCERFVEQRLNYNGCVATHSKDTNFASHTWRIFLGSSSELYRNTHDTITLLDAEGKAIDSLTY